MQHVSLTSQQQSQLQLQFIGCSCLPSAHFLFGPAPQKTRERQTVGPPRPIHPPVKWLSSHSRTAVFITVTPINNGQHQIVKHIQVFTSQSPCKGQWSVRAAVENGSSAGHFNPEDSCCMFVRNVYIHLPDCTVSQPTNRHCQDTAVKAEVNMR